MVYFYRPGSFINLLIMIQRFLVKKININDFCKKLDKQKYNFRFKDGIMDDCFVPNIQFFYPKDYLEYLRKLNFEIFGANLYTRTSKKYDFHKFHASVIFFLKKISNKKISNKYKDYLSPSDNIDVLDHKIYNKNKKIKDILKMLYKNESEIIDDNFKKVIMIQKLKINITKKYFDSYFLNKAYVSNTLEKVKKILQ